MTSDENLGDGVPEPVRAFLATFFASVAEVDVLVHLFRRGGPTSADRVGSSTGLSSGHARIVLDALVAAKIVTRVDGGYRVADTAMDDVAALAAVADRYRRRIVEIVMAGAAHRDA